MRLLYLNDTLAGHIYIHGVLSHIQMNAGIIGIRITMGGGW